MQTNNAACCHVEKKPAICHDHQSTPVMDTVMFVLEKISLIALGIFTAYKNINLFLPYMAAGLVLGFYSFFVDKNSSSSAHGSACSQGFLEHLTGVKLPAPISLLADVAITLCHIDHHASVFVPIAAGLFGAWAGKSLLQAGDLVYRKFVHVECPHKHARVA